ncbi:MAG: hypothetical protein ABH832_04730 [bacterium]
MFEDQKNQKNVPANLPTEELVDIFEGVEKENAGATSLPNAPGLGRVPTDLPIRPADALTAGLLKEKQPDNHPPLTGQDTSAGVDEQAESLNQLSEYKVKEPILGKIVFIVMLVIVAIGLVIGGWWAYSTIISGNNNNSANYLAPIAPIVTLPTSSQNTAPVATTTATQQSVTTTLQTTSSISGQMNRDNILFGQTPDTDKDGIDDIREQELKTDPNNSDSDNDGLSDGDEVLVWNTDPLNPDSDNDTYLDGEEIKNGYNPLGPGRLFQLPVSSTSTATATTGI